jgi:hypothetical protein
MCRLVRGPPGVLFDLMGLDESAEAAYVLGVLGAVPTALSGTADWLEIRDEPRRVGFVRPFSILVRSG